MTRAEAVTILRAMIERRRERSTLEADAAEQMRSYAWGVASAHRRAMAYEMADQHQRNSERMARTVEALTLLMEDGNGGWNADVEGTGHDDGAACVAGVVGGDTIPEG